MKDEYDQEKTWKKAKQDFVTDCADTTLPLSQPSCHPSFPASLPSSPSLPYLVDIHIHLQEDGLVGGDLFGQSLEDGGDELAGAAPSEGREGGERVRGGREKLRGRGEGCHMPRRLLTWNGCPVMK